MELRCVKSCLPGSRVPFFSGNDGVLLNLAPVKGLGILPARMWPMASSGYVKNVGLSLSRSLDDPS